MARACDVYLCHSGGGARQVKQVLEYVRAALQALPSVSGTAPIRVFRDEDDLIGIGGLQDALRAAIQQAPIGAQWPPAAPKP